MERKTNRVDTNTLREAGDLPLQPAIVMQRRHPPDRGDAKRIQTIPKPSDKFKLTKPPNINPEDHPKELVSQATTTAFLEKETPKTVNQVTEKKEDDDWVAYRKRVKDKYTLSVRAIQKGDIKKEQEPAKNQSNNEPKQRSKESDKNDDSKCKSDKSTKSTTTKRKPVIKTITSKNDAARVFKAVTFMEQKPKKPLQIKLPSQVVRKPREISRIPKLDKSRVRIQLAQSKLSVEKPVAKKKKLAKSKRETRVVPTIPSAQVSAAKIVSPPTEIAKWAASSAAAAHAPYYEAWVNTTLAAISKLSKKDKLFLEKQNVLQTFKRQLLQRQLSPVLVHENYADEKYTGKIKVRQR